MMTLFHLLASAVIATAGPVPVAADIAWVAEGGFCEPETVLPLPDNTLLVSNVCDFRQRGNGFLSLLDANGKVLNWRIVTELDAPLGMAIHDNRLHLIDNNRLKIMKWPEFELVNTIDLDTSVANDLTISPQGANGIGIHDGLLYVGGERLWRVNLQTGNADTIGPDWMSDIDGIEFESDGTIQVTPVGGSLIRYRDEADVEIIAGPGISSANHGYSENLQLALIPTGYDNTVIAVRVPSS